MIIETQTVETLLIILPHSKVLSWVWAGFMSRLVPIQLLDREYATSAKMLETSTLVISRIFCTSLCNFEVDACKQTEGPYEVDHRVWSVVLKLPKPIPNTCRNFKMDNCFTSVHLDNDYKLLQKKDNSCWCYREKQKRNRGDKHMQNLENQIT